MKKGSFLILIFFSLQIILTESACCPDESVYCLEVYDLKTSHRDNTGVESILSESDTVPAIAYALGLQFNLQNTTCEKHEKRFPSLINSAYALSCPGDRYESKDRIVSYEIHTLLDFNDSYAAGSDISNAFIAEITIDEINLLLNMDSGQHISEFYLFDEPTVSSDQQFVFIALFEDGGILTDTTTTVYLTK